MLGINPQVVVKRRVYVVYQVGIANVFVERAGRLMLALQFDYRACENFARGAVAVGATVLVKHCDRAGNIATMQEEWQDGCGDLWADKKSII